MVKFAKQIDGQLVPEWRAAYVNYKSLKKDLKRIKQSMQERRVIDMSSESSPLTSARFTSNFSRVHGSFETFVALTGQALAGHRSSRRRSRKEVILQVRMDTNPREGYKTELVDGIESERLFFTRLDSQFNKVNQFYKSKENDFIEQAETLEKQMQALIELQRTSAEQQHHQDFPLSEPVLDEHRKETSNQFHADSQLQSVDQEARRMSSNQMGAADLETDLEAQDMLSFNQTPVASDTEETSGASDTDEKREDIRNEICRSPPPPGSSGEKSKAISPQLTMRMRIPLTTPGATISAISHNLWEDVIKQVKQSASPERQKGKAADEITVSKKKVQLAQKMLRAAFVEYYRGLTMLKSYISLNMVAFAKILKKYDKVSGQRASTTYLKVVESSYFNTSDRIIKLMEKVEELFTKHFAQFNRQKAMMSLRPRQRRASHSITFSLGLFSGGSLALLAVFIVLVHGLLPTYRLSTDHKSQGLLQKTGYRVYLETIFPTFSMSALILLHMYMYGVNLYFWRQMRINYPFIFEFQPGTELRHREVLMVTSVLTTMLMGIMVGQLTWHSTNRSPYVDFLPFALVMVIVTLLFFPLNICYRSSRVFFLNALLHIVGSPLYKVVLADFFLADQLTSQVPMLRNLQYVICYYMGGYFRAGSPDRCSGNSTFKVFTYVISLLPYWWRLMQCIRRYIDETDNAHVANGGKYLSALVAVVIRLQYGRNSSNTWMAMYIISSTVATIYQLYWDLVVDWGLLQKESTNPWLRDRLIMPKKKTVYFLSMVLNAVLRLAWLQSVTHFSFGDLDQQVTNFAFASLEVIRRGHWNFYRLENEHLNNVGKYRATRTVPLPFEDPTNEDDD